MYLSFLGISCRVGGRARFEHLITEHLNQHERRRSCLDLVLCYVAVFVASLAVALPWVLSYPITDIVVDFGQSYLHGKPLPPVTAAFVSLRPYCLSGALVLAVFTGLVGGSLVRSSRQPLRSSLFFVLAGLVLAVLSFTFVSVALVLPLVLLTRKLAFNA